MRAAKRGLPDTPARLIERGENNQRFDERLRGEDSRWGVRDLGEVQAVAVSAGFHPPEIIPMPANNLSLVFRGPPKTPFQG